MTDSSTLDSLNGQQYLVLRPEHEIASFWDATRDSLRRGMPATVSFPNTGHVTLRGFSEPTRIDDLEEILRAWAERQAPIRLRVEAIDGFPPPFQILIARLQRTSSLIAAYAGLTSLLDTKGIHRLGELPLEEWVFHMSLIYAGTLDQAEWHRVYGNSARALDPCPSELITSADFVWYADGIEHVSTLDFGG